MLNCYLSLASLIYNTSNKQSQSAVITQIYNYLNFIILNNI